ncbi:hypothetical protein F5884DRAFT_849040 [Xylogone sp. PMI_703]|nr:hypothetical protein F5884DRAFT_849040 [Xylogone sp. PMI_703]
MAGISKIASDRSGRRSSAGKAGIDGNMKGTRAFKLPIRKNEPKANKFKVAVANGAYPEKPYGRGSTNGAEFYNGDDRSTLYGISTASAGWDTPCEDSESFREAPTEEFAPNIDVKSDRLWGFHSREYDIQFSGLESPTAHNTSYPPFIALESDGELEFNEVTIQESTLTDPILREAEACYYSAGLTPLEAYDSIYHRHEDLAYRLYSERSRCDPDDHIPHRRPHHSSTGYEDGQARRL